ncbi:MAG: sigma-70 family RNA polymerase sigma factor [Veillonella sp.]|uniref:RNA polymerase sigma factor n=1 Tax=Veillonella sp. TaxID=1926307 RepID=UPI0025DA6429|nr:sigma-70 family RNA polymerase sigma factor [Veillonella sp.]MBE6080385.1 sigma-70 family RNA polymerase sigma factor [Veillonella sp.]
MTPNVAWSDNQLMATVNAAQQNNQTALRALCLKYEGLIHKYAHVSAVQCEGNDMESLLWEVFIRAVKEYDINGDVPFSGFVKSRIKYGQYNAFRKLRKQWQRETFIMDKTTDGEDSTMTFEDILKPSDSAETIALGNTNKKAVTRVFKRLMPQQQQLLYNYYVEDIPLARIAKNYGVSRQAMQQHKNRALAALTVFFNEELNKKQ